MPGSSVFRVNAEITNTLELELISRFGFFYR